MRARTSATIAASLVALLSPFLHPAGAAVPNGVGVVTSNLIMNYDLGNPAGLSGATLNDLSGNFGNGTLIQSGGSPALVDSNGRFLNFTGANAGYVDLPDLVISTAWTGLTVSFYANFGSDSLAFERIMDFGNGAASDNILIARDVSTNAMYIEVINGSTSGGYCRSGPGSANSNTTGSGVITANTWNQYNITIGGGFCTVYKDNVQVNRVAYTRLPGVITLTRNYLGGDNWGPQTLEGAIGEFALYNRVLDTNELTQNYNAQRDITAPTLSSSQTISSPENASALGTITTSGGAFFSLISNLDFTRFSINNSGVLAFVAAPNFESPTDTDGNNVYDFTMRIMDVNGNFSDFAFAVTVTNLVEVSLVSAPTFSGDAFKGEAITITVTPSGDGTAIPGRVTYLVAGKRIPGCIRKIYTGSGNSTCSWKPPIRGNQEVSVTFTPTNSNFIAATSKRSILVARKSSRR